MVIALLVLLYFIIGAMDGDISCVLGLLSCLVTVGAGVWVGIMDEREKKNGMR